MGTACNIEQHIEVPTDLGRNLPNYPHFRLGALAGSGCDTLNNVVNVVPEIKQQSIQVYPNPTKNHIQVDAIDAFKSGSRLLVYNTQGAEVFFKILDGKSNVGIDLQLPEGVYFYRILEQDTLLKSGKLVVQD